MSNKKHIDRVFQEKLKDFEVSPSPKVWQNIKGELKQSDDDEKLFPIWLRFAGVAALLLVLFTIGNKIVSNSDDSNNNTLVDTENRTSTSDNEPDNLNINNRAEDQQNASQDEVLTNVNLPVLNSDTNNAVTNNSGVSETNLSEFNTNRVAESNTSNTDRISEDKNNYSSTGTKTPKSNVTYNDAASQRINNEATSQPAQVIVQNESPLNKTLEKTNKSNLPNDRNNSVSSTPNIIQGVAQNNSSSNLDSKKVKNNNLPNDSNNSAVTSTATRTESVAQINSEKLNNTTSTTPEFDKDKADATIKNNTSNSLTENQSNTEEQEENITTDEETEEDSPSIEEEIAKAEDIIEKEEEKVDRWQVYANVAPVYYNTLSKGSHIDDQFVENSKSGEINTSYGVNVSYVLNKKLKLRAGFNSLDLSYDTDNVILYENVGNNSSSSPRNLDLNSTGISFSAISNSNLGAQQLDNFFGENANAAISQRIGYYEVPLELEYNLVDTKFGVNVIGGFSTFFLNDNKVYSEFDGYKTEVGQANNINNVSFSGNLGLGLDYKFSDNIKVNVQPTFKYQLNAYKNTSGSFRPYIVGVYTGLSYSF